MIELEEYGHIHQIKKEPDSILFSAMHIPTSRTVCLRYYPAECIASAELEQVKHKWTLMIKNFKSDYISKIYDLKEVTVDGRTGMVIVFEAVSGLSLKDFLAEHTITIEKFFNISMQLISSVAEFHKFEIRPGRISSDTIFIHRDTGLIKLSDLCTLHGNRYPIFQTSSDNEHYVNSMKKAFPYLSPEQTGRINVEVDYRSDFYTLGIIFYELLTGKPPFNYSDPMKIVHAHIARLPVSPSDKRPDIPRMISDIVLKLLEKSPGNRYKSTFGIRADLNRCQKQFKQWQTIPPFALGTHDVPEQLQLSPKLYGRDEQFEHILGFFESVRKGQMKFLLVDGLPGIGKSRLIHELHKPVTTAGGFFITGKYDQFHYNIPYAAFIHAFQEIINQILAKNSSQIEAWRKKLLRALGTNGQLIIDVIPEVELIIGKQKPVPELSPAESKNRFNRVCKNFLKIFASKNHPLVIFLDDLQWADSTSLQAIENLFTRTFIPYCFFIGAYRCNEINRNHPLAIMLRALKIENDYMNFITLEPICEAHINLFLVDTLSQNTKSVHSLARFVHQKSGGNPFHFRQFIQMLYSARLLAYDFQAGFWRWEKGLIQQDETTDNVIDMMSGEIRKLSAGTQEILKYASCLGNRIDLQLLSIVSEKNVSETAYHLWEAVSKGFILAKGNSHKLLFEIKNTRKPDTTKNQSQYIKSMANKIMLFFSHDKIQQAVYALLPVHRREELHYKIGRLMLDHIDSYQLKQRIFDIVKQLNHGVGLLLSSGRRNDMAKLNLNAGKKAKNSTAYTLALRYLNTGISLLPDACWTEQYELTFSLHNEKMECEYLNLNFNKAEQLFHMLIFRAKSPEDKARVYNLKMVMFASLAKHQEALDIGLEGIGLLGIKLSTSVGAIPVLRHLYMIRRKLEKQSIDSLLNLPEMTQRRQLLIMRMLINLSFSAYLCNPYLIIVLALKIIELTLKYGSSAVSAFGYAIYGATICALFGNYQTGNRFGELALRANEKSGQIEYGSKIFLYYGSASSIWKYHINHGLSYNLKGYKLARDTGDLNYALYHIQSVIMFHIAAGTPLSEIHQACVQYYDFVHRTKDIGALSYLIFVRQFVKCLKGETKDRYSLDDENFLEKTHLLQIHKDGINAIIFRHYLLKLRLLFIMQDYKNALKIARTAANFISSHLGSIVVPEYFFYCSLVLACLYKSTSGFKRRLYWMRLKRYQKKIRRMARYCPDNFEHKALLIDAEVEQIKKNDRKAMALYQKAILSARETNFIHMEAIANERTALYFENQGLQPLAETYMKAAVCAYEKWGATSKIKILKELHPQLLHHKRANNQNVHWPHQLDYTTVLNSLQTISTEIVLDRLLVKLMKIIMENAGARKGFFLAIEKENLHVKAVSTIQNKVLTLIKDSPVDKREDLSLAVVNYVRRTRRPLVLDNACRRGDYLSDPYIMKNQPKSIVCLPVIRHSEPLALLYLENNLAVGLFTQERIETLQLLASQAAISLENAKLYEQTARKESELRIVSEKLRSLSSELLLTEERERRRIAVALHDRIGHALSNARLHLGLLQTVTSQNDREGIQKKIGAFIDQSVQDTQSLTFELSPPVLYDLGLAAAIEWLLHQTHEQHGIQIDFQDDSACTPLDNTIRVLLFQATRELLFNIVKHAKAEHAKVSIMWNSKNIHIEIQDDGIGFDRSDFSTFAKKKGGFGLFSIQERLKQFGGHMEIISQPGQGSRVILISPMKSQTEITEEKAI